MKQSGCDKDAEARKWEARSWLINASRTTREPQPAHLRSYSDEALDAAFATLPEDLRAPSALAARVWAQMRIEGGHGIDADPNQAAQMMLFLNTRMQLDGWAKEGEASGRLEKRPTKDTDRVEVQVVQTR